MTPTPKDETADVLRVEQVDRVAAADANGFMGNGGGAQIVAGREDDTPIVQAFARHRLAALSDRAAEREAPFSGEDNIRALIVRLRATEDVLAKVAAVELAWFLADRIVLNKQIERLVAERDALSLRLEAVEGERDAARRDFDLPADIAEHLVKLGTVEWGSTPAHDADGHGRHVADSVRLTAAHYGQEGDQKMQGLYLSGTETVVCHTGTSPNSVQTARTLTGAWNYLFDRAVAALATTGGAK